MNCYYVGYFDASALADGDIREIRLPDEERHIFSSKKKAREYVNSVLNTYKEEGMDVEKMPPTTPDDHDECWWITNGGGEQFYITLECTYIQ